MSHRPNVFTPDLDMPTMIGSTFLLRLIHTLPPAVIAVSSRSSDKSVFKALELGALDFIAKPGGRVSARLEEIQSDLLAKVQLVAEVRMENLRRRINGQNDGARAESKVPALAASAIELVAVGCSTGGPPAL